MKKLLLSMILIMANVVLFAQNNSNEANESVMSTTSVIQTVGGGLMVRDGMDLKLDGRILSDSEVRDLVGEANFETYLDAKNQIKNSKTYMSIFIISGVATAALMFAGLVAKNMTIIYVGYIPALVANVTLPLMCIYSGIGKGRMNWVANEYNEQNKSSYSFNISPSIMRCNVQPAQANLGIGMTFTFNF